MRHTKTLAICALLSMNGACSWDGGPVVISDSDHNINMGGSLSDSEPLTIQVRGKLKNNGQTALARIQVSSPSPDTVRLAGYVDTPGIRDEAERLAYQVEGVRFVVNTLTVRAN